MAGDSLEVIKVMPEIKGDRIIASFALVTPELTAAFDVIRKETGMDARSLISEEVEKFSYRKAWRIHRTKCTNCTCRPVNHKKYWQTAEADKLEAEKAE